MLVTWHLTEPIPLPARAELPRDVDPAWAVAVRDGLPVLDHAWVSANAALVALPSAISTLRREDPALASAWQHAVGGVLREALAAGWHVGWDPTGAYLLTSPVRG